MSDPTDPTPAQNEAADAELERREHPEDDFKAAQAQAEPTASPEPAAKAEHTTKKTGS